MKHKLLLALLSIALVSQSVWAAKGGNKPEPIPQPNHVVWVDANGEMIGDAQTNVDEEGADLFFEFNEKVYKGTLLGGTAAGGPAIFGLFVLYDGDGCTGNAYVHRYQKTSVDDFLDERIIDGIRDGFLYVAESYIPQEVTIMSWWWENGDVDPCTSRSWDTAFEPLYPAIPVVDTNNYAKPYKLKLIPAK